MATKFMKVCDACATEIESPINLPQGWHSVRVTVTRGRGTDGNRVFEACSQACLKQLTERAFNEACKEVEAQSRETL